MSKTRLIIIICIFVLLAIPAILGLLRQSVMTNVVSYQGSSFMFPMPKNWTMTKKERSDIDGTEFFLQPPDGAVPETPHVTIDVAPATQIAVSTLTDPFTIFHYTMTTSTVNGIQAQKYTTIVHASEGVLHATAYVFQAKGSVYLLSLGYKQEASDTDLENQFQQIVTHFALR